MSGAVTGINRTASLTPIHSFVKFLRIFTLERLNIESLCSQEAKVMHCVINVSRERRQNNFGNWLLVKESGYEWMEEVLTVHSLGFVICVGC